MHQHIPKNEQGRDFVVGDIHGQYNKLMKCLGYEGFDEHRGDRLFSVGDLIDRGPKSLKCLKLLDEPWFFAVRGNHEEMMIHAILGTGKSYNWATEYGQWVRKLDKADQVRWAKRLQNLPLSMTIKAENYKWGICHAEPDGRQWKKMRNSKKSRDVMLWGRRVLRNPPAKNVEGVHFTVHGHTPLDQPIWVGNRYFMDTGAGHGEALTVRKIDDIWAEYSAQKSLFGS